MRDVYSLTLLLSDDTAHKLRRIEEHAQNSITFDTLVIQILHCTWALRGNGHYSNDGGTVSCELAAKMKGNG